jgi:acetyl esterase
LYSPFRCHTRIWPYPRCGWIDHHRAELGITNIVLQGESGGANLCLATTLAAKHDGNLVAIAGVYAMVRYISGAYGWNESDQLAELPSVVQNNGWFLNTTMMDVLVCAGVPSTGRVNLGLTHGADSIYKTAVGDVYDSTIADIARFARKVHAAPSR